MKAWIRLALAALLMAAWGLACAAGTPPPPPGEGRSLLIRSETVALDPAKPSRDRLGALRYLGGLELRSPDPALGGLSGLWVSPDGRDLRAVSDQGWWLRAKVVYGPGGGLAGLEAARLGPLLDPAARPLQGKRNRDAEGLAAQDGGFLVSFERNHRLWRYPAPEGLAGRPRPLSLPPWLAASPKNSGVEAVTALADGRLVLLAEDATGGPLTLGALGDGARWQKISYRLHADFKPTALAALPQGGCLVLERAYSPVLGARARLGWLPPEQLRPGAELAPVILAELSPPLTTDNFEGLALAPAPEGGWRVFMLSDDNYSPLQRTLLLLFHLPAGPWR
ncbi:MAG: esterase-like activity of phytase family protein [Proteobacteria bacterium]|nr:esterase-like activity of phytase family protein [Pseudomonadota bacterium]MBU1452784.1 esterase-like activity of phytase family protein [Pseudomonadota bacterium]MBU2469097.1 esterase-like activity of phytase family protein [Pseudomonadota bacterium]